MKQNFFFVFFLCSVAVLPLAATDLFDWQPVKVLTPEDGLLHWAKSEAYRDLHPMFGREKILPLARLKNPQVLAAFPADLYQDDTANAALMVLFYGPGWDSLSKTPMLLIHGAADDPFRAWVHPLTWTTPTSIPESEQGLLQQLVRAGYPVFAIAFSHGHGCNYRQAEQIHNAIQVIKRRTGAPRVHLVAHSKGNCAASLYLSDSAEIDESYRQILSPFQRDVDVYVQIGAANKGIDAIFRYYTANLYVLEKGLASPVCFYNALVYGQWHSFYREDIYQANPGVEVGNYFPGQCQLAYNLVEEGLDFSPYSYTPVDFNLTMHACYYGGTTGFVASYGIEHALREGAYTIQRLNKRGLDPAVRLVSLYGTSSALQTIDLGWLVMPVGVSDYPSDGVIYVHSASYTKGLTSRGARLIAQKGFARNHLQIAFHPEVASWLIGVLDQAGESLPVPHTHDSREKH